MLFLSAEGRALLKVVGFYPPETFKHVLDYVDGEHYEQSALSNYIQEQAEPGASARSKDFVDDDAFEKSPLALAPTGAKSERKLLVLFMQPSCSACERFHERVLSDPKVRDLLKRYRVVLLDSTDERTTVLTPQGRTITPRQWHQELQVIYDVATVFFDERGQEVHRLDGETGVDRMTGSLEYVLENAYERHTPFLQWRRIQAAKKQRQQSQFW